MANDKQFKPEDHLTNIKGKEYLEVKWRLVWFRQDRPLDSEWGIRTIPEIATEERAVYRAQIVSPEGVIVAEGTKSETQDGFPDFIEKAETGAIGRALAVCGYGTQFCGGELDEGKRIVDSPVDRKPTSAPQKKRKSQPKQQTGEPDNIEKLQIKIMELAEALDMDEDSTRAAMKQKDDDDLLRMHDTLAKQLQSQRSR